eukprot:2924149-Pyramimonas_sp.AAC.1
MLDIIMPVPSPNVDGARGSHRCMKELRLTMRLGALCLRASVSRRVNKKCERTRTDNAVDEGTASAVGLKRTREDEQAVYRRCKTARQTDLRVMLAGPKGGEVGESGELDTG